LFSIAIMPLKAKLVIAAMVVITVTALYSILSPFRLEYS